MLEPSLYRVRVNSCPHWPSFKACTLGISVGQDYHNDQKFAAAVEWAARHFEHIRVDVSDTLQRHRFVAEGMSYEAATRRALEEGRKWMEASAPVLQDSGKPFAFVRWDTWLQHKDFTAVHDAYAKLATDNRLFRQAVERDIQDFLDRHERRGEVFADPGIVKATSRAYLLEELAAITLQGRELKSARIYPGPQLACFKVVREGQVPEAPRGLEDDYYVHINLERRKTLTPRPEATKMTVGRRSPLP